MPTWPASLPQTPTPDGFREVKTDNRASFSPEVGPAMRRRRFTGNGTKAQCTFTMTDAQVEILDAFYEECADGAIPFSWIHPKNGQTYLWDWADDLYSVDSISIDANRVALNLNRLP